MFPKRSAWTRLPVSIFIPFGVRKALKAQYYSFRAAKRWDSQPNSKGRKLVAVPVLPNGTVLRLRLRPDTDFAGKTAVQKPDVSAGQGHPGDPPGKAGGQTRLSG